MGNFVPHLSHHTEQLRAMLKQDAVFAWDEMPNASFQKIKDLIAKSATKPLRYYDQRKPVTVQVDASQRGLGVCLLQEGQPIAYASKSLTDTETRYANIERELLAIVFACQQFNTYVSGKAIYSGVRSQATGNDTSEEPCKCPSQTAENAPPATAIRCDHQIQTREGNAARRCTEQMPLTSFWGNQTGYESRLHCLQQGLDSQTQGNHQGRPHSWHSLTAHSAGVATPKEAYSQNGQGILGLQRPALYRRGTAPDGSQNCHSILPSGGVSSKTPPGPSLSHQSTAECSSTPILARAGCRHSRLHKEVPGMHTPISASQRATAGSQCATRALGENCNGLLLHEWQVVYFDL